MQYLYLFTVWACILLILLIVYAFVCEWRERNIKIRSFEKLKSDFIEIMKDDDSDKFDDEIETDD